MCVYISHMAIYMAARFFRVSLPATKAWGRGRPPGAGQPAPRGAGGGVRRAAVAGVGRGRPEEDDPRVGGGPGPRGRGIPSPPSIGQTATAFNGRLGESPPSYLSTGNRQ